MPQKHITFCEQAATIACDGRCDKAWGRNCRPRDEDDNCLPDDALGTAPADPGTYEGGHCKPQNTPTDSPGTMNKWCARECERCGLFRPDEPIVLRRFQ